LLVGFEPCEHTDTGSQFEAETSQPSRGQSPAVVLFNSIETDQRVQAVA